MLKLGKGWMSKLTFVRDHQKHIYEHNCSANYWYDENGNRHNYEFIPGLTLYRYHNGYDSIRCYVFKVLRETPCGYWILDDRKEKWVSNYSRKRFCYPTKEEAWHNFKCRKKRQLKLLRGQVTYISNIIKDIEHLEKDKNDPDSDYFEIVE